MQRVTASHVTYYDNNNSKNKTDDEDNDYGNNRSNIKWYNFI